MAHKTINIPVDPEEYKRIGRAAKADDRSVASLGRKAIAEYLERQPAKAAPVITRARAAD